MMRLLALAGMALSAAAAIALAQEELPKTDESESLEIEPPLLIQNGARLPPLTGTIVEPKAEPEHLRILLDRAKQNAATGERQCRAGIIARVQVEERVLKVTRLEADLALAQLAQAKEELALGQQRFAAGEILRSELEKAATAVATATDTASRTSAQRNQAELDLAGANLRRQQKLLALGSARKADVERAAEKLAVLSQKKN